MQRLLFFGQQTNYSNKARVREVKLHFYLGANSSVPESLSDSPGEPFRTGKAVWTGQDKGMWPCMNNIVPLVYVNICECGGNKMGTNPLLPFHEFQSSA